jgi:uncharacterized protein with FMN-binding domain
MKGSVPAPVRTSARRVASAAPKTSTHVHRSRRNALVLTGTGLAVAGLFAFPTSTNRISTPRRPGQALAPVGVLPAPKTSAAPGRAAVLVVNGPSVDTRYGPVQVQLHVSAGRIVSATAIDFPQSGGRDREINGYAVPVLQKATVSSQGKQVSTVSGATFTSDGYRQSLQGALTLAKL